MLEPKFGDDPLISLSIRSEIYRWSKVPQGMTKNFWRTDE